MFSLSTLISKLSRVKIIGSFKLLGSAKVTKVGGIRKIIVLWRAVFLAASPLVTAPPSNLTRLYYNGSAAKSHSTTTQYRQLRRLVHPRSILVCRRSFFDIFFIYIFAIRMFQGPQTGIKRIARLNCTRKPR